MTKIRVCILAIIIGMAMITAALLHLDNVTTVAQVNFLAKSTVVGILSTGFGIIFLVQQMILRGIRQ